jgi:(p)ppGpp synthase/HD superfamily hydrolase
MTVLTVRFDEALLYTHEIHRDHARRGKPIIAHLLGVASLVLEFGGDEDEAIGALLHDAAEEAGGRERVVEIRERFGDAVAEMVHYCTDSYDQRPPPWRVRKERYLRRLPMASPSAVLISVADKLYNVRQLIIDLRAKGNDAWDDYSGGREGRLWYYRSLAEAFKQMGSALAIDEFALAVADLEAIAGRP